MKKIMSLALAGVMVMSMGATAFAADGDMAQPGKALTAEEIGSTKATIEQTTDYETNHTGTPDEVGILNGKKYYEIDSTGDNERPYSAHGASSVVVLNAQPTMFRAIVPIALHVSVAADTTKTYPDAMAPTSQANTELGYGSNGTAKIVNLCPLGMIKATKVQVVAATNYTLHDFDATDYENLPVNTKTFGFQINGVNANATTGYVIGGADTTNTTTQVIRNEKTSNVADLEAVYTDYTESVWKNLDGTELGETPADAFPVIANGSMLPITYQANLPAFSSAVENVNVGAVVFTLDFHTAA